jgi:hypothetical protein
VPGNDSRSLTRLLAAWLDEEGSTNAFALMRIGIVLNLWSEWSSALLLYKDLSWQRIAISAGFYGFTSLLLIGWHTRLAAFGTAAAVSGIFWYIGGVQQHHWFQHHHSFLLVSASWLLLLCPCGGSLSLDRSLQIRRALRSGLPIPPERGPLWARRLFQLQVTMVYLGSAYNKSHPGFLSGIRLEHLLLNYYTGSDFPEWPGLAYLMPLLGTGTVLTEYLLAFGLWIPRLRRWLIPIGFLFHAMLYVMLPIQTFSTTMWVLYLAFVPPESVSKAVRSIAESEDSPLQLPQES